MRLNDTNDMTLFDFESDGPSSISDYSMHKSGGMHGFENKYIRTLGNISSITTDYFISLRRMSSRTIFTHTLFTMSIGEEDREYHL